MIKNDFSKTMSKVAREIHEKISFSDIINNAIKPLTNAKDKYFVDCFLAFGRVETCMEQLQQSPLFLSNFRSTESLKKNNITRFDHIIYHIESYFFRLTGLLDRLLILTNFCLELGLTNINCKPNVLINNLKGKEGKQAPRIKKISPNLLTQLIKLNNIINDFREIRNEIAHEKRYIPDYLKYIEMLDISYRSEKDTIKKNEIKKASKKAFDYLVTFEKNKMTDLNDEIIKQILMIYNEMNYIFLTQSKKK
jgi:hypothetical protein